MYGAKTTLHKNLQETADCRVSR